MALFIALALFFAAAMAGAWSIARKPGKSGWTDTIWSYATGIGGTAAALLSTGPIERRILVATMVGMWGLRLGTHILRRTLKGVDDARYAQLRQTWGSQWETKLFRFLMIQAAAALALMVPIVAAASNPAPAFAWSDWAGLGLLVASVMLEGLADRQLRNFAADPANRGQVMDRGLWAWSRHPNYFFEWTVWFAYVLIAVGPWGEWDWGWAALFGPALIYWLLVHASGIPPTEAHMVKSRGRVFREYQARVNAFFPGPPRG
ncbi:MAG: DUF1295 domain-containing protein [Sphingomicrobium sp.]